MRFGVYLPNFGDYADPENLLPLAEEAETAGWEGFFLWDHLILSPGIPIIDAWIAAAAIAARTKTMRIGPMITPLARRRPWKVAREVVSLDRLSRGRAVLGVGLGDPAQLEYGSFGEDPDARVRGAKLDEALDIVAGLSSGSPFRHHAVHYRIDEVSFVPTPVQTPRVPIWVAGFWPHRRPMRRAARWDGVFPLRAFPRGATSWTWSSLWLTPAELREIVSFVKENRAASAGAFDVVASGATPTDAREARKIAASFAEVGATWWLEWLDDQRGTFAEMRDRVRAGPPRF